MGLFSKFFLRHPAGQAREGTALNPKRIAKPTIGFLNLKAASGTPSVEADRNALATLFDTHQMSTAAPPLCDVLFLYCDIDKSGNVVGTTATIRDLIKNAGASIAIVASENPADFYVKSARDCRDWPANIVFVVDRKAESFTVFFRRLFEAMFAGSTMLLAWVKLAPQIPGRDQPNVPATIMLPGAGHIVFERCN